MATEPLPVPKLAYVQALAPSESDESLLDRDLNAFIDELWQVRQELRRRGIDVRSVRADDGWPDWSGLHPGQVFVFGDRSFMGRVVDTLGLNPKVACSYPSSLAGLLNRRHWYGTPHDLLQSPARALDALFVKPCRPIFRGRQKIQPEILDGAMALHSLPADVHDERLFCSEVVEWMSEYRCYILNSRILGIHRYFIRLPDGWEPQKLELALHELRPTEEWIQAAVQRLDSAGEAVAGYCLDVGLIAFGRMSLVEMNDGLALTNYGLSPSDYLDLHLARWQELLAG